jgi:hypothetical protein
MQNLKDLPKPRKPNQQELEQLTEWYRKQFSHEGSDMAIATAHIAVFDKYKTFYPGFVGKLMVVVWGIAPSAYQVFFWENKLAAADKKNGEITPLNPHADFRIPGADRWD